MLCPDVCTEGGCYFGWALLGLFNVLSNVCALIHHQVPFLFVCTIYSSNGFFLPLCGDFFLKLPSRTEGERRGNIAEVGRDIRVGLDQRCRTLVCTGYNMYLKYHQGIYMYLKYHQGIYMYLKYHQGIYM